MEVVYEMVGPKYPEAGDTNDRAICMVRMSPSETLATIQSLTAQLAAGDPNSGRYEKYADDGTYFSISVHNEEAVAIHNELFKLVKKTEKQVRAKTSSKDVDIEVISSWMKISSMLRNLERYAKALRILD